MGGEETQCSILLHTVSQYETLAEAEKCQRTNDLVPVHATSWSLLPVGLSGGSGTR